MLCVPQIAGKAAPTLRKLDAWLDRNPGFDVADSWSSAVLQYVRSAYGYICSLLARHIFTLAYHILWLGMPAICKNVPSGRWEFMQKAEGREREIVLKSDTGIIGLLVFYSIFTKILHLPEGIFLQTGGQFCPTKLETVSLCMLRFLSLNLVASVSFTGCTSSASTLSSAFWNKHGEKIQAQQSKAEACIKSPCIISQWT